MPVAHGYAQSSCGGQARMRLPAAEDMQQDGEFGALPECNPCNNKPDLDLVAYKGARALKNKLNPHLKT